MKAILAGIHELSLFGVLWIIWIEFYDTNNFILFDRGYVAR